MLMNKEILIQYITSAYNKNNTMRPSTSHNLKYIMTNVTASPEELKTWNKLLNQCIKKGCFDKETSALEKLQQNSNECLE